MARQLASLAVLCLVSLAAADRGLLAHKATGGSSLHAVAVAKHTWYDSNGNGTWSTTVSGTAPILSTNPGYLTMINNNGAFGTAPSFGLPFQTNALGQATSGVYGGPQAAFFPSRLTGLIVGAASNTSSYPSILISKDSGTTWQVTTGMGPFPASFYSAYVPGTAYLGPLPANTNALAAPDLTAVTCSGSYCWAVGGWFPPATLTGAQPAFGVVLRATVPGTYWTYAALPAAASVALLPGSAPLSVGALFAIASDSSGKHLYAVGAPASNATLGANGLSANGLTFAAPQSTGAVQSFGSIIYSGNYGANWAVQSAPAIYNQNYTLFGVTVIKGTIAYAVGGNPYANAGNGTSNTTGVIIATSNGGFSWYQQPLLSLAIPYFYFNSGNTPAMGSLANGSMPLLTAVANSLSVSTLGGAPVAGATPNVMVWVTGCNGMLLYANLGPRASLSSLNNQIYGPNVGFSLVKPQNNPAYAVFANLLGIVWDNNLVGYVYGTGILMSTHDGGNTWLAETPNILVTAGQGDATISGLAVVPTTY